MENLPWQDFDVRFFSGAKLTVTSQTATLIDERGVTHPVDRGFLHGQGDEASVSVAAAAVMVLLRHAREAWAVCKRLESTHVALASHMQHDPFPLTIGRRPHNG